MKYKINELTEIPKIYAIKNILKAFKIDEYDIFKEKKKNEVVFKICEEYSINFSEYGKIIDYYIPKQNK